MITEKQFKMDYDVMRSSLNGSSIWDDTPRSTTETETPFVDDGVTDPVVQNIHANSGPLVCSPANVSILSAEMYSQDNKDHKQNGSDLEPSQADKMNRNDHFPSDTNMMVNMSGTGSDEARMLDIPPAPSTDSGILPNRHHPFNDNIGSNTAARENLGMVPYHSERDSSLGATMNPSDQPQSTMYYDGTDESHFGPDIHDPVNSLLDCDSNNPFGLQMKPKINESSSYEDTNIETSPQPQQMGPPFPHGYDASLPYVPNHNRGNEGYQSMVNPSLFPPSYDYNQMGWSHPSQFNHYPDYRNRGDMDQKPPAVDQDATLFPNVACSFSANSYPVQDMRSTRTKDPPYAAADHFKSNPAAAAASSTNAGDQPLSTRSSSSSSSSFGTNPSPQQKKRSRKSPSKVSQATTKRQRTSLQSKRSSSSTDGRPNTKKGITRGVARKLGLKKLPTSSSAGRRRNDKLLTRYSPSPEELEEARTPRKISAVHSWYDRLNDLIEYKERFGDTNVPQKYVPNPALGIWVNKQRMEKKQFDLGEKVAMTSDRVKLLEKIGFVWAKKKGEHAWQVRYDELVEYRKKHGHCNVPTKNSSQKALGRWVSTQRSMRKKFLEGRIEKDIEEHEKRIQKLNDINFCWSLAQGGSPTSESTDEKSTFASSPISRVKIEGQSDTDSDDDNDQIKEEEGDEEEQYDDDKDESYEFDEPNEGHHENNGGSGGGGAAGVGSTVSAVEV